MHPFVGEAMVEIQEMHLRLDQLRAIENLQAALEPLDVPALQVTEAGHLPLKQRWFQIRESFSLNLVKLQYVMWVGLWAIAALSSPAVHPHQPSSCQAESHPPQPRADRVFCESVGATRLATLHEEKERGGESESD